MSTDTIWSLAALAIAIACYAGARHDADRAEEALRQLEQRFSNR